MLCKALSQENGSLKALKSWEWREKVCVVISRWSKHFVVHGDSSSTVSLSRELDVHTDVKK